jgi:hypothetical protein
MHGLKQKTKKKGKLNKRKKARGNSPRVSPKSLLDEQEEACNRVMRSFPEITDYSGYLLSDLEIYIDEITDKQNIIDLHNDLVLCERNFINKHFRQHDTLKIRSLLEKVYDAISYRIYHYKEEYFDVIFDDPFYRIMDEGEKACKRVQEIFPNFPEMTDENGDPLDLEEYVDMTAIPEKQKILDLHNDIVLCKRSYMEKNPYSEYDEDPDSDINKIEFMLGIVLQELNYRFDILREQYADVILADGMYRISPINPRKRKRSNSGKNKTKRKKNKANRKKTNKK